jgi:ABC-type multidrug transport system ATPase subunit
LKIQLQNVGKKFRDVWIFQHLDFSFSHNLNYAILGANGSGKSTLMQILAGLTLPSEGSVICSVSGEIIDPTEVYKDVVYAAPYVQLFDQLNLEEMIKVHLRFKRFYNNMSPDEVIERMMLVKHKTQPIEVFSSGMKQRLRLGLAVMSESKVLFLDEPNTNLDENGKLWYDSLVKEFQENRTVIVSSNHQEKEYTFCDHIYNL